MNTATLQPKIIRFNHFGRDCQDKFYGRDFREVFPAARIVSARIRNIDTVKRGIPGSTEIMVEKATCEKMSHVLAEKIDEVRRSAPNVIFEENTHEAALPFAMALREVFGTDFAILSLDAHLDALANMFAYCSFWKFGINQGLINASDLAIFGSNQVLGASRFLSFFDFDSKEDFICTLLSLMPSFSERLLHTNPDAQSRVKEINNFIQSYLSRSLDRDAIIEDHLFLFAFDNCFGGGLRSLWEAEGLKQQGALLMGPPSKTRKEKGSKENFNGSLEAVNSFVAGKPLLISLDIDVILHPENLFAIAREIRAARPQPLAINIAGLNSRNIFPVGAENAEIKRFLEIVLQE